MVILNIKILIIYVGYNLDNKIGFGVIGNIKEFIEVRNVLKELLFLV